MYYFNYQSNKIKVNNNVILVYIQLFLDIESINFAVRLELPIILAPGYYNAKI